MELAEGTDVTFYDFLGIKSNANQEDINKAYKKRSRLLHPDKVKQQSVKTAGTPKPKSDQKKKQGASIAKGSSQAGIKAAAKEASDRFARLGIVTNILRGPSRARYDHFLNNGFPKWRGTGYYYARFRPGLGTVLLSLFVFVGGAGHYGALYLSWKREREFVGRYIAFARHAAWGDNMGIKGIPGVDETSAPAPPAAAGSDGESMQSMNRRQRRMQEKDAKKEKVEKKPKSAKAKDSPAPTPPSDATGPRKKVRAENGKIVVVDSVGNVYLEQQDDEGETQEVLIDVSSRLS